MAEYPDNWGEIALFVKESAGWKCENCEHPHEPETKANCSTYNLVALCQRCHLSIQAKFKPGQAVMGFARPGWMIKRGLDGRVSG
jgi:hypothetical protein